MITWRYHVDFFLNFMSIEHFSWLFLKFHRFYTLKKEWDFKEAFYKKYLLEDLNRKAHWKIPGWFFFLVKIATTLNLCSQKYSLTTFLNNLSFNAAPFVYNQVKFKCKPLTAFYQMEFSYLWFHLICVISSSFINLLCMLEKQ
jgi:hypothetical protein